MLDFQIRHATQHDFAAVVRSVQAMLREMEVLSSRGLANQAEAWLDFESRILQTLSCDEDGGYTDTCAAGRCIAQHLLDLAETIGGQVEPIGFIEASILSPAPILRSVQTLYIQALYVLPPCRCHGVGTALLRSAIVWGQQHSCQQAQLTVLPRQPARRLYRALGFIGCGLEMRKELLHPAKPTT